MFFWFNAAAITAIATSNMLFDSLGGHWVILPLVWVAGFVTHLLTVHVYWTVRRNTYSPGLLSSLLYAIVFYLAIRYGLGRGLITGVDCAVGTVVGVGTVGTFLTVGPTLLFPWSLRGPKEVEPRRDRDLCSRGAATNTVTEAWRTGLASGALWTP